MINHHVITDNINLILDHYNINYTTYPRYISMPCPIHQGDKRDALSIFTEGIKYVGNWKCWTHHCEESGEYDKDVVGFIKALMEIKEDKKFTFPEVLSFIEQIIGFDISQEVGNEEIIKRRTISMSLNLQEKEEDIILGVPKHAVRSSLIFPAKYFLDRGFSHNILDKYDVGFCNTFGKRMYGRVVVPVYNDDGTQMVGCVGRTIQPQCILCNRYHNPKNKCPSSSYEEFLSSKWINSKGFKAEKQLYNFWEAKNYINLYKTAILVEGQGDVWRLEEAGIKCGLGLFGAKITDGQLAKLQATEAINVIIATDSDEAGKLARTQIANRLYRMYNIIDVETSEKDIGESSIETVQTLFKSFLEKFK